MENYQIKIIFAVIFAVIATAIMILPFPFAWIFATIFVFGSGYSIIQARVDYTKLHSKQIIVSEGETKQ